ncbi:MAG: hemerythrin domain-containing protein [Actinomycetota bacterium]|nr:hemerythrin domain-containing protein [Actinomycetota bacterium]MDA2971748.1 hemerythrin domain-containing protein [Actinomycetota bacterium]MDA3000597.1 hemerythrin domain-containing protein [Actinomycetota bacterium]
MTAMLTRIHEEHREMLLHVKAMRTTAELVGHTPHSVVVSRCEEALQFFQYHLLPHARAEEQFLYPVLDRLERARLGSALLRWDHAQMERYADDLRGHWEKLVSNRLMTDDVERRVRETLLGLHDLVVQHFTKEDDLVVPLLEANLSQEEADEIEHDMTVLERRLV